MPRLAIIGTHPIQYYAPWFAYLDQHTDLSVRVFYLWDQESTPTPDPGFGQRIIWDVPLLEGYRYEFVQNRSRFPGTDHFLGINSPALGSRIRAFRPDAVLLTAYKFFGILSFIMCWKERVPLLFRGDSHRLIVNTGYKEWLRRKSIAAIFRHFSAALYVGQANYEYFRMHGMSESQLFFSPHSIDQVRFSLDDEHKAAARARLKLQLNVPEHHTVVLYVGKLLPGKGLLDLLAAFDAARLTDTSLVIVGSGELEHAVQNAVQRSPLVKHLPFQNQSVLPEILALGDILVLPSSSNHETWGLIVNEAMQAGQAILVSDQVGCYKDLLRPEQNGLIFPAGDRESLKRCLEDACADRSRLAAWGRQSKEIVAPYSYENASKGLLEALTYLGISATDKPFSRSGKSGLR